MKKFRKIIIILAAVIFLVFIAVTLYVKFYWRDLLVAGLRNGLKRDVTISDIYFRPPLGLSAYKVEIQDLLKADAIIADLNWHSVFEKKIIVSSLVFVRPIINIQKTESSPPASGQSTPVTNTPDTKTSNSTPPEVWIQKFFMEEGQVRYSNQAKDAAPFEFKLENVRFKAEDFYWPLISAHTKFMLTAQMAKSDSPLSQSKIEANGWLDWVKKDMEGTFKILEANQYAGLVANVKSVDNHVRVEGDFDMNNFPPVKNNSTEGGVINQIVYGALSNAGVKIGAKFAFDTKMDDFRVSNITFSGNVVTEK